MNRRRLLGLLGVGLAGAAGCSFPVTQSVPTHRIARLSGTLRNPTTDALTVAFRQGLNDLGNMEGHNLIIEERYADGAQRLAEASAEVVRLQVEAIFVPSVVDARIVRAATTSIPIVCGGAGDLVTSGLAASLARPGGNVTGLSTPNLIGRQLELLQQSRFESDARCRGVRQSHRVKNVIRIRPPHGIWASIFTLSASRRPRISPPPWRPL